MALAMQSLINLFYRVIIVVAIVLMVISQL